MQTLVMLNKTDEFSSVFSFRKRFSSTFFVVHYMPNMRAQTRIGFVVAKRVAKRAVDRNYMRRVMREYCRRLHAGQPAADVVIQVHKTFAHQDYGRVTQELMMLFANVEQKLGATAR